MANKNTFRKHKKIEPPPLNGSNEELDEYFSRHSLEDLERAGLTEKLSPEEEKWLDGLTASIKAKVVARRNPAQLSLALSDPDFSHFLDYARQKHIPASTLARAWILERLEQELHGDK